MEEEINELIKKTVHSQVFFSNELSVTFTAIVEKSNEIEPFATLIKWFTEESRETFTMRTEKGYICLSRNKIQYISVTEE